MNFRSIVPVVSFPLEGREAGPGRGPQSELAHALGRRTLLAGMATSLSLPAFAQSSLNASEFGVIPDSANDQSAAMQQALDQVQISGQTLVLPPGRIVVSDLTFPARIAITGSGAGTRLVAANSRRIGVIAGSAFANFRDLIFDGAGTTGAILEVNGSDGISFDGCQFSAGTIGLQISDAAVLITNCRFGDHGDAAIHASDSRGLVITGNHIVGCGNGGIRIWRSEPGNDASIVSGNHLESIDWRDGGNGQNGNGINVFKADGVIIADNRIGKCAFSAIRLNATNNTQVSGNICTDCQEIAIFSEFGFSGSVIANNIVDGAAGGISITNFDQGGQLAVCTGNLVRNITPNSPVNPDTVPYGIAAQADTAVTGNTISGVPGLAISAGYGPYLRNVLIASNVVTDSDYGIGVSVAPEAGSAHIANNLLDTRKADLIGLEWDKIVSTDLAADALQYPKLTVSGNS